MIEDPGCRHVASDDAKVRRRILRGWLLDDRGQFDQTALTFSSVNHAVRTTVLAWDRLYSDHRSAVVVVDITKLPRHRCLVVQQIVGEDDRKWASPTSAYAQRIACPSPSASGCR